MGLLVKSWLPLAGTLIFAPLPSFAATIIGDYHWASGGGYASTTQTTDTCSYLVALGGGTCSRSGSHTISPDETISGTIDVGSDPASGNLIVNATASGLTAHSAGEAQFARTIVFGGKITPTSTAHFNEKGFWSLGEGGSASATLTVNGAGNQITSGTACSENFGSCPETDSLTSVTIDGDKYTIRDAINISQHGGVTAIYTVSADVLTAEGASFASIYDPIWIDVPPGVTWTSTTGDFLTNTGSAPELSTWTMLLIGFAGIGLAGYRSSRMSSTAAA